MSRIVLEALRTFTPREVDRWILSDRDACARLVWQIENYPAMVLPDIAKPTVICGVVSTAGVGEMWMITGKGFEDDCGVVLRQQRRLCTDMFAVLGLHRLHMMIDTRRDEAKRWARGLGFEYEATLKKMGARANDVDIFLWSERSEEWVD